MAERVDPNTWEAPALPARKGDSQRVIGAMYGSLLYERPEHRPVVERLRSFLETPGPVMLEIGFDHAMVLLESARQYPEVRWIGAEIREHRVSAAAQHAPANALLLRADARSLLAGAIPEGRLQGIYALFPSPSHKASHLLVTPDTVALFARALAPEGRVMLHTDVPGMGRWIDRCFSEWESAEPLVLAPVLSRRERVCRRDGRPVWRFCFRQPA